MYAALSFNSFDESFVGNRGITRRNLGFFLFLVVQLAIFETHFFFLFSLPSQMKAVLSNLDLLVEDTKWWNFQIPSSIECYKLICTMLKRQAVVIFPEVNYELSLVMKNVKRESWRQFTSSPKIVILVLIMHTAWSPNTSS
jgi:hypothetical protein